MLKLVKKILFVSLVSFCFLNTQCDENEVIDYDCEFETLVSETKYSKASSEGLSFIDATIEGDCLSIKIGASGCDGNSWEFNLIDSGAVAESFPEQRFLKLDFNNTEACLAFFERTISFDLKPIRVEGSNKIVLHIDGFDESIEYSY